LFLLTLAFGLFAFETSRFQLSCRQVSAICDAAALTGTTMLANAEISNDQPSSKRLVRAQQTAAAYARNMILKGYVQGQSLSSATNVFNLSNLGKHLKAGSANYVIALADPANKLNIVPAGSKNGTTIRCFIAYCYRSAFLGALGFGSATITGCSNVSLPQVDSVLVFDYSARMDDNTVVTFVRRQWTHDPLGAGEWSLGSVKKSDLGCGIIQYVSIPCPVNPSTISNYLDGGQGTTQDSLYSTCGMQVNALPPQNLSATAYGTDAKHANIEAGRRPHFDIYLRSHYPYYDDKNHYQPWPGTARNRSLDYGTPPGNCDLPFSAGGNGDGLSDTNGKPITAGSPPYNAFTDPTWTRLKTNYPSDLFGVSGSPYAYPQPYLQNDTGASLRGGHPDENTFTDLIVNIAPPSISGPTHNDTAYPYEQPMRGPDVFRGFSWTFDEQESDAQLKGRRFDFPNIAVVVEAARGNLERTPLPGMGARKNFECALLDRPIKINGTISQIPKSILKDGYQKAYQRLAMMFCQPLATVLRSADEGYFQYLHARTDCHFGLVGFSSKGAIKEPNTCTQGTYPDSSVNPSSARSFYTAIPPMANPYYGNAVFWAGAPTSSSVNDRMVAGGSGSGFRVPRIPLDAKNDRYLDCRSQNPDNTWGGEGGPGANGLYNGSPLSVRDTSEALATAQAMFHSDLYKIEQANCRPAASRAIILFTAGAPTGGSTGPEAIATKKVVGSGSRTCRSDGIIIYTIDLNASGNPQAAAQQAALLGGTSDSGGEGLAALGSYGGRYFPLRSAAAARDAFKAIASHLALGQR
jgi:hypothetical protein